MLAAMTAAPFRGFLVTDYGCPMEYGSPLHFYPVVSSFFFFCLFFLA